MKANLCTTLFFSLLTAFASCQRHPQQTLENTSTPTLGTTVGDVGKNVRHIFKDSKKNLWIACDGEGLFKYDGKTILRFTDKDGLCGNSVKLLQQENDSTLLIVTSNGVCRFDGHAFSAISATKSNFNASNLTKATWLYGNYFQNNSLVEFQLPQTSKLTKSYSPNSYAIYCTLKDSKGNLWFGTESRGVGTYDGNTFSWLDTEELGLAIRTIAEDKSGNIWIGNNGYGLFRYDGKTLTNITKDHHLENPNFITTLKGKEGTLARVWTIAADASGNLWIGTIDAGLWKFDGNTFTNYTIKDGLSSNSIWTLMLDSNGILWIGTTDNGVMQYDGKAFTRWPKK